MSKDYILNPKAPTFQCRQRPGSTPRCVYSHLYISTQFDVPGLLPFGFLPGPILEVDNDAPPPWSIDAVEDEELRGTMEHIKDGGWFCIDSFTPGDVDVVATRLKRRILYSRGKLRAVPESVVLTIWSRQGLSETIMQLNSTISIHAAETILNPRLNRSFNLHRPCSLAGWLVDRNLRKPLLGLANDIWRREQDGAADKQAFFRSEPIGSPIHFTECSRVEHGLMASRSTPSLPDSPLARPRGASAPRTPSKRIPTKRIPSERTTSVREQPKWTSSAKPTDVSALRAPPKRVTSERTASVREPPRWTLPWRKPMASQPTASQPTPSQPTPSQPTPSQPTPSQTKPLRTKPLRTKPLRTKPLRTKPLRTKPLQTTPSQPKLSQPKLLRTTPPQPTPLPDSQAIVSWAPTTPSSSPPPPSSWFLPADLLSDSPPRPAHQRPQARSGRSMRMPRSGPQWAFNEKGQMIGRHECGCESPGEPCSEHKGSPHFTLPPLTPLGQSWRANPSWFEGLGCDRNGLPYRKNGD